ncbi:hypothetical protein BGZ65_009286 [Modicella reniformis]|uniref:Galactose oxidase n=1 Tax=Modicella reniformis TaxID=1440133 RepID=A0A9P6ME99_9FUNG|nr:hypothetical protein BGZ65_009286 [Modicella reniformis]
MGKPLSTSAPAFARTSTKLYICGGHNTINRPQFFSLDLAVAWTCTQPAWQKLADGPVQQLFPAVFSADEQTMITFHSGSVFAMKYSVATNSWYTSMIQAPYAKLEGVNAVTDPDTGMVYLAAGYTSMRTAMSIYSFTTDSMGTVENPLPDAEMMFQARAYYQNVWSKKRNSILYFGGYNARLLTLPTANVITEYVPATGVWQTLMASGTPPQMRADHCMASNDNGTLVIIYGGRISGSNVSFTGDLYIFDTVSQTWRTGKAGPPRCYMACTIAGNQFVAWGGIDETENNVNNDVLIYNIDNDAWVSMYTPPSSYATRNPRPTGGSDRTNNTGDESLSASPSHTGAIIGGLVGGLAVIIATVMLIVFLRRRYGHRRGASLVNTRDDSDRKSTQVAYSEDSTRNYEELRHLREQLQNQQEELDVHRRLLLLHDQQQQQQQQHQQQQQQQQQQHQHLQQQGSFHQPAYTYEPPMIYTAEPPVLDAYGSVNPIFTSDTHKIPIATTVGGSSMSQYHVPSSHQPYVATAPPYQPVPSHIQSHTSPVVAARSANISRTSSYVEPTDTTSNQAIINETGSGSQQRDRRPPPGLPGDPQFGARER